MVFLQPSTTESAFIFSTDDGSDAIVLDIKGVYALIDGGNEPLGFMNSLRTPTAAIVSSAAPAGLRNALEMNKQPDSLVAVVGNLPSAAALKDAAAAEPLRELYKTLSLPPVVAQLKGAKPEPLVIHKGLSSGTLSVYTLAGDAKDAEAVAKAYQSGSCESIEAAAAAASSVLLVVWQPAREDQPIKRILHLGSAPLPRIQQALDRARALPFLQSATASAASLKAKPAAAAGGAKPAAAAAARPAAKAAAPAAAKPAAARAAAPTAARTAAPAARAAPATRAAPTASAPAAKPASARASMMPSSRPAAAADRGAASASSSAARPARTSAPPAQRAAAAAPAARAAPRGGGAKEEVAKKTMVSKSSAAPSSARSSAPSTPSRPHAAKTGAAPSAKASPAAAAAAAGAAVAAVAATTVVAASAAAATGASDPSVQHEEESAAAAPAAPAAAAHPSISVSIDEPSGEDHHSSTPGGLPVPASPTIIPATPQPPMSPEPTEEEEPVVSSPEPVAAPVAPAAEEEKEKEEVAAPAAPAAPSPPFEEAHEEPVVPSAPLEPAASVDEPECVVELVEEDPQPEPVRPASPLTPASPSPVPSPAPAHEKEDGPKEDPYQPLAPTPADEEPEEVEPTQPAAPAPTPVEPATGGGGAETGDLLGDFGEQPVAPQQPGEDGLLDSLEEPMKKMQISMDTDKLAEELGLTGGEKKEERGGGAAGETSLLDLTQESTMDTDLDKTQNTSVIESAHEFDDLLSPRGGGGGDAASLEEMQRKLSEQAEESLLTAAADPFIAGLASTVVEAATIDGAKSTLESLISNNRGVESPTGDKLLSFRSSGYENPDEPKEVKYEESDPAIDDVLTKLADESDMVNGAPPRHGELNGHGDSAALDASPAPNGHAHHEVHGNGWPEGTTMHLPPPTQSMKGGPAKFKLAGPVHVDLVTVPHRGKQILLTDEAASVEFFSSVRSSLYLLQTGGEVPLHVLEGWRKGKGVWATNVASRLIPTHHNEVVARWAAENQEELAEIGLTVATPVDLTTLTYPDGQAKACTVAL